MPLSMDSPSSSFYCRVRTKLSACLIGFLVTGYFRGRGGVVISEEIVRGRFNSFVRFGVEGREGSWALSDALVCRRRRYDKYAVVFEKKLLLTGAKADVGSYLEKWRKTVVNRVCESVRAC
jgi:hypothetical protein